MWCCSSFKTINFIFNFSTEKEVIVIERFGSYDSTLRAGVHFIMPFIKRPKVKKSARNETIFFFVVFFSVLGCELR
jgi:regulator of protease activity HflC (stomatin/prohibitin superfamily)